MPYSSPGRGGFLSSWGGRHSRIFRDRRDAGRQLADRLLDLREAEPIVLALPRGGVPVGYEIARELEAPLDVFLVRKIGAPGHRELGIGAVAQGGVRIFNESAIQMLGLSWGEIETIVEEETAELERRLRRFRGDRPLPDLTGHTVILVDDGLATGVTALAAIRALRRLEPARIILAVPVCAAETARTMRAEVDDLVCVHAPEDFMAVGLWYENFEQTTDEEVVELLEGARDALAAQESVQGEHTADPALR
jgi:predicted phosphoribosyltransferase